MYTLYMNLEISFIKKKKIIIFSEIFHSNCLLIEKNSLKLASLTTESHFS